ncbi:MAG: ribonuclease H-like domain-containing protein [Planctomycetota bacterium]|nr:ribonuclease H-like domain-containing protein [Planctomycetota bacterium]
MTNWNKRLSKRLADGPSRPAASAPPGPAGAQAPHAPIVYPRDLPVLPPRPAMPIPPGPPVRLDDAVVGAALDAPLGGEALVVTRGADEIEGNFSALSAAYAAMLADPGHPVYAHVPEQCGPAPLTPRDIIFLDLETTGLNTGNVFLAGAMLWENSQIVVKQFFARDYAEESAIVSLFLAAAQGRKLLVSFNGKSFDLPYLRVRAAACRVPFQPAWGHMDLLHVSRKTWARTFGDCKLQTLERHLCRRFRQGDIPGAAIPEAYHDYVRTGNAVHMAAVIKHNMLDLLTLAELMTRLPPKV